MITSVKPISSTNKKKVLAFYDKRIEEIKQIKKFVASIELKALYKFDFNTSRWYGNTYASSSDIAIVIPQHFNSESVRCEVLFTSKEHFVTDDKYMESFKYLSIDVTRIQPEDLPLYVGLKGVTPAGAAMLKNLGSQTEGRS